MITHICQMLHIYERRACSVLGQARATQRRLPRVSNEEDRLTQRIIELATKYGRYGYRRITALLRQESWGGEPQEGRKDLETGRTQGAQETTETRAIMAE